MKKVLIIICSILFIYCIGGIVYSTIDKKNLIKLKKEEDNITIKGYNYLLNDNDSLIYKDEFYKLKQNLENNNINYVEYAESISKLFIIDLYTLNNKKNKYEVGGTEFIYPNSLENYKLNVQDTLYKYIIDNIDNKRTQELPVVSNVSIDSEEEVEYEIDENKYDAYKIKLTIEYEKDLGYDKNKEITIIKEDKVLYIVQVD